MQSIDTILEQYRNSDLHGRLNLYLLYRELRKEFIAIDRADIHRNALRSDQKEKQGVEGLRLCLCS